VKPLVTLVALTLAMPAAAPALDVREETLSNGMRLLMVVRPKSPTVAAGWVARAGSAVEEPGATGTAHLLEHVMFKGTRTIGTVDFDREAPLQQRLGRVEEGIAAERDRLRAAHLRGELESRTSLLTELEAERRRLLAALEPLQVRDELDAIYTAHGAVDSNAFTSNDFTAYVVTIPAGALELWFWLESDRLVEPVFRDFSAELDVVLEERRLVVSSDPTAEHLEAFDAMFWTSSPYRHPVIGWPADLEGLTRADLERYFTANYSPGNITAVLVGGFDPDRALALARTYLERIPPRTAPRRKTTEEVAQPHPRRARAEADTTPSVLLRWHTVPFVHRDAYTLDVVSDLLDGRSGRLYQAMVDDQGLGSGEPYAVHQPMRRSGMLELGADVADGSTHAEVEAAMLGEVARLQREPVGPDELERARSLAVASYYRSLRPGFDLALELLIADAMGDWRHVTDGPDRWRAVTADDILRVARTYLGPNGLNALWFDRPASP
jgi:predicted Zn-dependent peptidase